MARWREKGAPVGAPLSFLLLFFDGIQPEQNLLGKAGEHHHALVKDRKHLVGIDLQIAMDQDVAEPS